MTTDYTDLIRELRDWSDGPGTDALVNRAADALAATPLAADNFEWSSLYTAVSCMVAKLGRDGAISTDDADVDRVMDALHRLDAGQFVPGLTPRAALAEQPSVREPLSEQQIDSAIEKHVGGADISDDEYRSMFYFARAIEAMHGIGVKGEACD